MIMHGLQLVPLQKMMLMIYLFIILALKMIIHIRFAILQYIIVMDINGDILMQNILIPTPIIWDKV